MSKKQIKEMTDDEFATFLKKAAKNFNNAAQTMETNYVKGMQSIIDYWSNR